MKLVEILAKELKVWPGCVSITQDYDGDVGTYHIDKPKIVDGDRTNAVWTAKGHIRNIPALSSIASDHATAIVTRADWESERARIAKPAKNADKDGWIRHRGGKCPVDDYVFVDVRFRDKEVITFTAASSLFWEHGYDCEASDIMAYKLHRPAKQVEACSKPELRSLPENYGEIIGGSVEGPIQWRDRITEIDAAASALAIERAELGQKLASEGFALIGRVADATACQPDPGRWMIGDSVECVSSNYSFITVGTVYVITGFDRNMVQFLDDDGTEMEYERANFKFHSRPSD